MLTQERAQQRSRVIRSGSLSYHFHVCLLRGEVYSGYAEIVFDLMEIPKQLVLDFKGRKVGKVILNGHQTHAEPIDKHIPLDTDKLLIGTNTIGIHYFNYYDNDGSGCVSFVDVDDKQYVYTEFEPYNSNRVFPCFDQPDLKAEMKLSIISPKEWKKVISNQYATCEQELDPKKYLQESRGAYQHEVEEYLKGKEGKMTIFPKTKPLSTYLYCFVAGQYLQLELQKHKRYRNIPMSLYSIESLYEPLKRLAPFIFEITIESMRFYQSYFNYPFAFNKYDQVFAHQYRWGAMENAGIVTFNDNYLFKEEVSVDRMLAFASTVAHQLSHHWFGNLVTMKWWDDLWLNQAFATFIAYFCLQKLKPQLKTIKFQSAMSAFFQRKGRGYQQDQMVTTHPIKATVTNTSVADSIFDGITYSKGAATMKQFCYLMGEQNFSKGLSSYFHKYEWKNATIDDFLGQMQTTFKVKEFSLSQWKSMWLQTSSLNVLEVIWDPKDKESSGQLVIKQSAYTPEHSTLRYHKIKAAFFLQNCDVDVMQILVLPQPETIIEYNNSKPYKAVLLNFQDHGYLKTVIDPVSLDFLRKNINNVKDVLSRFLIWNTFYSTQIPSHSFINIITTSLPKQPSDSILQKVLDDAFISIKNYTPAQYRDDLNDQMFQFVYKMISQVNKKTDQNRITILKSKLFNFAVSEKNKVILLKWSHDQDPNMEGVDMTIGQKWKTVTIGFTLKQLNLEEKQKLFQSQKILDPSDTAKRYRLLCNSLRSTDDEFEEIYQHFRKKQSKFSVSLKESVASGWNHPYHLERLLKYRDRFFKDLQYLVNQLDSEHFQSFYTNLAPLDDDLQYHIDQLQKIKFPEGKQRHSTDILKMVDTLKKRLSAYKMFKIE